MVRDAYRMGEEVVPPQEERAQKRKVSGDVLSRRENAEALRGEQTAGARWTHAADMGRLTLRGEGSQGEGN